VTLDDLVVQVERHRRVVNAIEIPYPHLQAIASEEKALNREFLVIATR
jgi:hypothetical protein